MLAAFRRFDRVSKPGYNHTTDEGGRSAMYAKFCVNRETANNFMRLFVNRRAYAIQA